MIYEWDETKRVANSVKHGVDFTEAEKFDWSTALETQDTRFDYEEIRWVALGCIDNRLHVLIYTERANSIRLISLRRANKREVAYYEKEQA
ncbi:MAG: BrnT family toxin [Bdellovibrionales bacterium]